ncbi:MAG: zonular occludens toxin domain-containing protein [Candidatus Coproplasma sp.]
MIEDESLIIFFGECGTGKTSLMMHFADEYVKKLWGERLELNEYVIRGLNVDRKKPLNAPTVPPIYSNTEFILHDHNGRTVKPIHIKGNELGLNNNEESDYKYIYPASLILLDEAHNEFNSKGESLARGQRDFFNKRRHNRLKIMLASPRAVLIHKDIRGSGAYGVEVRRMVNSYSRFGTLISSKWYCREFTEECELERYIKSDGAEGRSIQTVYEHKGNVFDLYDSFAFVTDFAPPDGKEYYK